MAGQNWTPKEAACRECEAPFVKRAPAHVICDSCKGLVYERVAESANERYKARKKAENEQRRAKRRAAAEQEKAERIKRGLRRVVHYPTHPNRLQKGAKRNG